MSTLKTAISSLYLPSLPSRPSPPAVLELRLRPLKKLGAQQSQRTDVPCHQPFPLKNLIEINL